MNDRGLFKTLAYLVLALAFIMVGWILLQNYSSAAVGALNACQERGGKCMQNARCQVFKDDGAYVMLEHNTACERSGEVCCNIPDNIEGQPGTTPLAIQFDDRRRGYVSGSTIELLAGTEHQYSLKTSSDYETKHCQVYVMTADKNQVLEDAEGNEVLHDGTCNELSEGLVFTDQHLRIAETQGLELDVVVKESSGDDAEQLASAKFTLDLEDPVSVQTTDEWSREAKVSVRCEVCQGAQIELINNSDQCYDGQGNQIAADQPAQGGQFSFTVQQSTDNFVCVHAVTSDGRQFTSLSNEQVLVDNQPPQMLSVRTDELDDTDTPNVLELECQDGLSGCEEYHYHFFSGADPGGLREKVRTKSNDVLEITIEDIIDGYKSFQVDIEVSACDNPLIEGSQYRTVSRQAVDADQPVIDVSDKMYGAVCVYAVDKAGNANTPVKKTFFNSAYIKEQLLNISIGDILAALAG